MLIPHRDLEAAILRRIVEEFVTRDGTDASPVEERIAAILRRLENGEAELHFDSETQTANLLPRERASR